ncbi:MAG: hypothetical protein LIP09_10995 [Bacteroidales bacterium]|nr:hypothetical protein [Bacteroidales bacterium]
MKKQFYILIIFLEVTCLNLLAQDNQPYLIQYKNGDKTLINLPSTSKVIEKKDYIEIIPYSYKLRLQNHNITKKGFVTPQYVTDSLTSNTTISVNCDYDKVSLSNPRNEGYSMIFDEKFHQISSYPPKIEHIEFEINQYRSSLYWLSCGRDLLGIDISKWKR